MRFRCQDVGAVLKALKDNASRPLVGPSSDYKVDWQIEPRPESQEYARAVGWQGIKRIRSPEYYQFPKDPASGWGGMLVVDRPRKTCFVATVIY